MDEEMFQRHISIDVSLSDLSSEYFKKVDRYFENMAKGLHKWIWIFGILNLIGIWLLLSGFGVVPRISISAIFQIVV